MDAFDTAAMTGIVWRRVAPGREAEVETAMHRLMMLSRASTGFLGSEIFPPIAGVQDAYVVIYRFQGCENLRRWLELPERRATFRQMEPMLLEPAIEFVFAHRRLAAGTVSSVFSYRVRKGCEEQFLDWRRRIAEACRMWPGYLGSESFEALGTGHPDAIVVVRFDSRDHLDAWMQSPARAAFIHEVGQYVENYQIRRIGTGFEGWFDFSADTTPPAPWRQGLIVLTALFPMVMILRAILAPVYRALPFAAASLVLLVIDVTLLTYIVMPNLSRAMNFWLRPTVSWPRRWRSELAGWGVLLGILALALGVSLGLLA